MVTHAPGGAGQNPAYKPTPCCTPPLTCGYVLGAECVPVSSAESEKTESIARVPSSDPPGGHAFTRAEITATPLPVRLDETAITAAMKAAKFSD